MPWLWGIAIIFFGGFWAPLLVSPDNGTTRRPARMPATYRQECTEIPLSVVRALHPIRECLGTPEFTHTELGERYGTCRVCGGYGRELS